MATRNGERFIEQQIASIRCQLGCNDELVISDDGSSDATRTIIAACCDPRIRLLNNPRPGSPVRNFEHALRHAQGEYIFLSDQDDLWEPDKIKVQAGLLETYDTVVSDCCLIDAAGELLADSFFELRGSGKGFWKNLYKNSFLGCCMAFRRRILEQALPFPEGIAMHDIWIGLVAERFGTTCFCPDRLVRYRRHGATATQTGSKSPLSVVRQLSYRWYMLHQVLYRKMAA
jgi:glycosyltransferase involved in cell wall biosynthesis